MSGIFYDPGGRCLRRVHHHPDPDWAFVTHDLTAGLYQCRRIMKEWLSHDELFAVDWSGFYGESRSA